MNELFITPQYLQNREAPPTAAVKAASVRGATGFAFRRSKRNEGANKAQRGGAPRAKGAERGPEGPKGSRGSHGAHGLHEAHGPNGPTPARSGRPAGGGTGIQTAVNLTSNVELQDKRFL